MIYHVKYDYLSKEDEHDAAIKLLSAALKCEAGIDYKDEEIILNHWGKPSFKKHSRIFFNISHCRNCVACVISTEFAVGIDVENVRGFLPLTAEKICGEKELRRIDLSDSPNSEFFKHWTLKESYIKAIGKGMSFKMREVLFEEIVPIKCNQKDCFFTLLEEDKFITSVCYKSI